MRCVAIGASILGLAFILQGCGSGRGNGEAPAPPPSTTTSPAASSKDALTSTWTCTQDHGMDATHSWTVPTSALAEKQNRGDVINSQSFHMPPFRGQFHLSFYPKGRPPNTPGKCSIVLAHDLKADWNALLNITINGVSQSSANRKFQVGQQTGFTDFGQEVTDGPVEIVVRLSDVKDNSVKLDPPDIVTRKVHNAEKVLVQKTEYTCWRYLVSSDPEASWQKIVNRLVGNTTCNEEAKRAALEKVDTGGATLPEAECDGNDVLLTQEKVEKCKIDELKSRNCPNNKQLRTSMLSVRRQIHQLNSLGL